MFGSRDKILPEQIKRKTISTSLDDKQGHCKIVLEGVAYVERGNEDEILDEVVLNNMLNELGKVLKHNSTKYNPLPQQITFSYSVDDKAQNSAQESDYLRIIDPRWTLDDVYINESAKVQLLASLFMASNHDQLFQKWGLQSSVKSGRSVVLNFYGPPGTGKSMLAEAVAAYLAKKVFVVNYSELESKYVGETPKNISQAFARAREADAVLVFDEADSFLGKRLTNVSQSADYGVNITRSVMMLEIERFEGVVIFTTNLLQNYDEAFKRRILANIEFSLPQQAGRKKIWDKHIPKELPIAQSITPELLSCRYENISGADIKDIVLYAAVLALQNKQQRLTAEHFDEAYNFVRKRYVRSDDFVDISTEVVSKDQVAEELTALKSVEG